MSQQNNLRADELAALVAVARAQSFVGAGRALQRDPTIVSKRISSLEKRLGVRLVERTTRHVRMTDAGARLAEQIATAHGLIDDAELEAAQGATQVRGRLRIAFPAAMGRLWLAPRLPDFLLRYPALQVETHYSDTFIDIIADGFDAAVRIGSLADSRLVARKLASHRRVLAASPAYLKVNGTPTQPEDLSNHNCLGFEGFASFPEWRLSDGNQSVAVVARGSLQSNDSQPLLEAARAGVGVFGAGEWLMRQDFALGTLVPVLPDWSFDADGGIYLVRPSLKFTPARTEAFVTWMSDLFANGPPWQSP